MAAMRVNVGCGMVSFQKDSEIGQAGPSSLSMGKRLSDRRGTCSITIKNRKTVNNYNKVLLGDGKGSGEWGKGGVVRAEEMDEWMKESVVEIVKNLREAPLLVHVYNGGETTTVRTEKWVEESSWAEAMGKWKRREMAMPEGVIFVEQLEDDEEDRKEKDETTRAWGVVVQGRGCECGPVCYLLKTTGGGGGGLGLCCTHFCLMRVKSFTESFRSQLEKCWLS